jgi:CheY-like chemotaxis protein
MKIKFLVVDDLPSSRQLFQRLLALHFPGCEVALAASGAEALELARAHGVDVAIVDALMPGMSGFDVCRALKTDPQIGSVLVLMVSAFLVETRDRVSGLESGADSYICKPFENAELIAQVRALLRIRENEQALRDSNLRLEEELAARRRAESATEEARRAAEAADRAKSEFLAHMSHEIRTPMNAVIGMTDLLMGTELTPVQRDYVETIRSSGETLLTIINQILDLAKIEAGRVELERRSFGVAEWLETTFSMVRVNAERKGLDLRWCVREGVPARVAGDLVRLRQLLGNLLGNAVKFTERGTVEVIVSAVHLNEGRCELRVAVRDTGVGIPPERMGELFRPFSQLDASVTRRHGGTGLGLAISKQLANLMGGSLWVESELGRGSTFTFTVIVAAQGPEVSEEELLEISRGRPVLVVDEDATDLRVFKRYLASWGFEVHATTSPDEALKWARSGRPFVVALIDIHQPGMRNIDLIARLRQHRTPEEMAVIVCSSVDVDRDPADGDRRAARNGQAISAVLRKPVSRDDLRQVLGVVLADDARGEERPTSTALPRRVLVAEDNPVNQKVVLRLLEKIGVSADVAENGAEALDRLRQGNYDAVLMDVQMPVMDGVETMRRIRADWPPERRPRIIAVTAHAMRGDREKYLNEGMDDYISKPLREQELRQVLARAAAGRSVSDGAYSAH